MSEIIIKGASSNNLKNIDIKIPKNSLVVITGLSGSGKSSLAFDTLFAEGQRRYVESLSSYARQFLNKLDKPDVDSIEGLSPSIAIEQKSSHNNPRSIVGTITEIYDYYRLLWSRVGDVHCPNCNKKLTVTTIDQIIDKIYTHEDKSRLVIYSPVVKGRKGEWRKVFQDSIDNGYLKALVDGTLYDLEEGIPSLDKQIKHNISIVIDRVLLSAESRERLADSIEQACLLSDGLVEIEYFGTDEKELYSQNSSCPDCLISVPADEARLFSFNNPFGACPTCNGLGIHTRFDINKIIPDWSKSYLEGAILTHQPTANYSASYIKALSESYNFSLSLPLNKWPKEAVDVLLNGGGKVLDIRYQNQKNTADYRMKEQYPGILKELQRRYFETSSMGVKSWLGEFLISGTCSSCDGNRLNKEALSVYINNKNIIEVTKMSVKDSIKFFDELKLDKTQEEISRLLIKEIKTRLAFLSNVGLEYLTLMRSSGSLSGGEAQRIRLATQIGSALTGVLYILDEPSIGLHQKDNERLLNTLLKLRDLGNTVIVVEHDEDTMKVADHIIDLGPGAGEHGGYICAQGTLEEIKNNPNSITGAYLSGREKITYNKNRRKGNGKFIELKKCNLNNLKNIDVKIPLGKMVSITGLSGSGKSTLLNDVLLASINGIPTGCKSIKGHECIQKVINIDQSPIGRTPRSNPATYVGLFTPIRELFASLNQSKAKGYKARRFSFNVSGGRCEGCQGDGRLKIEMNFLPDVYVKCDVCKGKRYNTETLKIKFKDKSISDVLDMTVEEANEFFAAFPAINHKLQTLLDVGLGYIRLGQSALTLSGGEAQRVKLALELSKRTNGNCLYVLDEPTTGLHFHDVKKLLQVLNALVDKNNSIILIEHNLDVIAASDYIIDLGPKGGDEGGTVVAKGTPEELAKIEASATGYFLRKHLNE